MIQTMNRTFMTVALIAACAISRIAQERASQPGKKVILHVAGLLDVKTGITLSDQIIVIDGDKITSVGSGKSVKPTSDSAWIELPNATVLPGLIDCHVHLTMSPNQFSPTGLNISYPRSALMGARNARVTLEAGFTTVRNLAADGYSDIALRDAINAGDVPGPRMFAS